MSQQSIKKPVAKNLPTIGRPSSSQSPAPSTSTSSFYNTNNNANRNASSSSTSRLPPAPPKPSSFQTNNANRTTSTASSNNSSLNNTSRLTNNNNTNNNNNNNKGKNTMPISSDLFYSPISKSIRTLEAYRQYISNFERPPAEIFASNSEELDAWKELAKQNSAKTKAAVELAYRVISQEVGEAIGDIIETKFQLRDELPSKTFTTSTVSTADFNQFKLEFEKMKQELEDEKLARKNDHLAREEEKAARITITEAMSEMNGTIVKFADSIKSRLKDKFTESKAAIESLQERIVLLESTAKSSIPQPTPLLPSISSTPTPSFIELQPIPSASTTVDKVASLPEHLLEANLLEKFSAIEESQEMLKFGLKSVAQTLGVKLFNNKKRKIDDVDVGDEGDDVVVQSGVGGPQVQVELEGLVQKIAKLDSSVKNFAQLTKTSIDSSEGIQERTIKLEESILAVESGLKEVQEKNSLVVPAAIAEDIEMGEAGDDDKAKNIVTEALEGRIEVLETTLATLESSFSSYFSDPTSSTHPSQLLALIESTSESLSSLTSEPSASSLQEILISAFATDSTSTEKDLSILLEKFISRINETQNLILKVKDELNSVDEKSTLVGEKTETLRSKIKIFMGDISSSMKYFHNLSHETNRVNKTFTLLQNKGLIPTIEVDSEAEDQEEAAEQDQSNQLVIPDL